MKRLLVTAFVTCILMTSCTGEATPLPAQEHAPASGPVSAPLIIPTLTHPAPAVVPASQPTPTKKPRTFAPITPQPTRTFTASPVPPTTEADANAWKELPVIPETVDSSLRKVYERGLELG